jgi:hypothetical protein
MEEIMEEILGGLGGQKLRTGQSKLLQPLTAPGSQAGFIL